MGDEEKINILIVDDNPKDLLAVESILSDMGQNLIKANSGKEALKNLLNQDFAVILLDVNMPEMDGFETAALIRGRDRSQYTPIIFITGIEKTDTRVAKGYSLGAVDYLLKPIVLEILKGKVAFFVDLFKMTQQVKQQAENLQTINKALKEEIIERKRIEEEREKLISELKEALSKVKTLSGLLPICSSCKKIRDDKGYWTQIEAYIRDRSEAEFSHGICPECMKKLYPEFVDDEGNP